MKLDSSAKERLAATLAKLTNKSRPTRQAKRRSSIEASASPILPDNLVRVTPELVVRKRVRSRSPESERQAKISKMDDLKDQLGLVLGSLTEIKGKMVVKQDLAGIKSRLEGVEESQKEMSKQQKKIEERLDSLERGGTRRPGPSHRPLSERSSIKFSEEFNKARRSLLLAPVQPYLPNLKDYFLNIMEIPVEIVSDLELTDIRRVHPRKMPSHRKKLDETKRVHVSFRNNQERDVVVSYASNLKEDCKLDIVVPDHLTSLKSKLDRLSYKIRKHASDNGKKVSTSLRLDDATESLVAAVRYDKEDQWLYHTAEELEKLVASLDKEDDGSDRE